MGVMEGLKYSGFGREEVPVKVLSATLDCDGLVTLQGGDDSVLVSGVKVSICGGSEFVIGAAGSSAPSDPFTLAEMINPTPLRDEGFRAPLLSSEVSTVADALEPAGPRQPGISSETSSPSTCLIRRSCEVLKRFC
jgi:hypothetical protein